MNAEKLRLLADHIEANASHFDMAQWGKVTIKSIPLPDKTNMELCGTTACIAGHACLLFDPQVWNSSFNVHSLASTMARSTVEADPIIQAARKALELTEDQAEMLFREGDWPDPFYENFIETESQEQEAKVAVTLLRHLAESEEGKQKVADHEL